MNPTIAGPILPAVLRILAIVNAIIGLWVDDVPKLLFAIVMLLVADALEVKP